MQRAGKQRHGKNAGHLGRDPAQHGRQNHEQQRESKWVNRVSETLAGKTLGILGLGAIGVELARKAPGKNFFASAGTGSITHIVSEYFLDVAGIDVTHAPYKGTSPALTDTISGQTQLVFGTVASTLPFVKSGKLRAIAVSSAQRTPALPDVPTFIEGGVSDFVVNSWVGLLDLLSLD